MHSPQESVLACSTPGSHFISSFLLESWSSGGAFLLTCSSGSTFMSACGEPDNFSRLGGSGTPCFISALSRSVRANIMSEFIHNGVKTEIYIHIYIYIYIYILAKLKSGAQKLLFNSISAYGFRMNVKFKRYLFQSPY